MTRSQSTGNRSSTWFTALAVLTLVTGVIWSVWPSKVELTADSYDIAIALYRVCDQRETEGLQKIQGKLIELTTDGANDDAIMHLQRIVDEAEAGNWTAAKRHAHDALKDQASGL